MSESELEDQSGRAASRPEARAKRLRAAVPEMSRARLPAPLAVIPATNVSLGVDPGLNRTGYAILERGRRGPILREAGVIRSTPKLTLAERVLEIGQGLREVCAQYRPDVMAIEQVFSTGEFPKTALLMAHARGAILYAAADAGVKVVHYTPRQIKKLLTGSGKAGKEQVQRAIANELRLDRLPEPFDVSDAAAVALCHFYSSRVPIA
jgi:crossover junction endodeoxyribonuclease RuvC